MMYVPSFPLLRLVKELSTPGSPNASRQEVAGKILDALAEGLCYASGQVSPEHFKVVMRQLEYMKQLTTYAGDGDEELSQILEAELAGVDPKAAQEESTA